MDNTPQSLNGSPFQHWYRVLRPLLWWVILVLVLFTIREHQIWIERTRLHARMVLNNKSVDGEAETLLDETRFYNGDRVSLGWHRLTISHPKAESFTTNLFIWYGERDLGTITLKRTTGTLVVNTVPPASILSVFGPEFEKTLIKSDGLTSSVPTDSYVIQSRYLHWQEKKEVVVVAGATQRVIFAPKLGVMRIESNREGIAFTLTDGNGEKIAAGSVPAMIRELPEGKYQVVADFKGDQRSSVETVKAGETNTVQVNFVYGAAHIETKPPGATVMAENGREYGQTPLTLPELAPGNWVFTLRLRGHLPVVIPVSVRANETNTILTNLVNEAYANAMSRARRALVETNLQAALLAAREAERMEPGDPESLAIQKQVEMIQTELLAKAKKQEEALKSMQKLAADAEAKLQAELRQQEKMKTDEKQRLEAAAKRERRAKEYFGEWMKMSSNSDLFDEQALTLKGDLADIEAIIVKAFTNEKPVFKLTALERPEPGLFRLQAMLGLGAGGWRRCDMVGGQSKDGEVTVVFKVFEYAYVEAFSLRSLIGDNAEKNMVPIHQSRVPQEKRQLLQRREDGIRLVRSRLQVRE